MISIVCFGNPLHADDAFGFYVYEALQRLGEWPNENACLIFAGTSPLDAVNIFEKCQTVIIVDAAEPDQQPGLIEHMEIEGGNISVDFLSIHRFSIADAVAAMQAEGLSLPAMELISVQARSLQGFSLTMSEEVSMAVEPVATLALARLHSILNQTEYLVG